MNRNRALELVIAVLGVMVGGMLGLWVLVEIVQYGVSK
jgi:hypothetical protein